MMIHPEAMAASLFPVTEDGAVWSGPASRGDPLHHDFLSESRFMGEVTRELASPTGDGAMSALLRIRLAAHVPPAAEEAIGKQIQLLCLGRVQQCVHPFDVVSNPKPGIILALLKNLRSEDDVEVIREHVVRIGREPFQYHGRRLLNGFNVGSAMLSGHHGDANSIILAAEAAMYPTHMQGAGGFALFTPEFAQKNAVPSGIEQYVRYALENRLLGLTFQPQFTPEGSLAGLAVISQMRIPDAAWIPENEFLPWIEDSDLILKLSQESLRSACLQASDWRQRGILVPSMSVVIPTAHFLHHDFVEATADLVREARIPGNLLEFGLTEFTVTADVEATREILHSLSRIGIRFYLRGAGQAQLPASYLRSLPIRTLQVSCLEDALLPSNSMEVLRAIVSRGQRLGLTVRAKDVQNAKQRRILSAAGCAALQGQFIAPPLTSKQIESRISRWGL
jgi:EAL domain-containing protein (putative c-di-GMP-specific phosphodiesterase class I)